MTASLSNNPGHDSLDPFARSRTQKAPNAFRTISEVADDLHIPQHVLRFWETKFSQVRPLKRGGGRRYYRPDDIVLLRRIADLLYTQGYTIKGVQRLLREGGGQLSDDIPPPPDHERATADSEDESLEDQSSPGPPGPVPPPEPPRQPQLAASQPSAEARAEQLRAVLQEVLTELEALRELLDR